MDTQAIATPPTRISTRRRDWSRAAGALAVLLAVLALIVAGLRIETSAAPPAPEGNGDLALYGRTIELLRHGAPYYPTITSELRANNYPLRPFVTVRLPTLSVALATLPDVLTARIVLAALALVTFAAWTWCFRALRGEPLRYTALLLLLASGIVPALAPVAYPLHEVWAGLLIALSLALRRPDRWLLSVAIATAAALLRELAAPYLLAMAALALKDGCRREALGWLAGLLVFALALGAHAVAVGAVVTATDPASPSWLSLGGLGFVLQTASWNLILSASPDWLAAILVPLALLGLAMRRDALGQRLALTVIGYMLAFLVVGRANNSYWGLMIAPLWPLGLYFAGPALVRLGQMIAHPLLARGAGGSDATAQD
jgi:hypothetical protein